MIYLDHAATSFPKPGTVPKAMTEYMAGAGSPGRSGHALARRAEEAVWHARETVRDLLGAADAERVVFAQNATMALNIAIKGLVGPGDRVLTSSFEHNSVTRPLHALQESGVGWTVVPPAPDCPIDLERLEAGLREDGVRLVVVAHASNVTGAIVPLAEIHALTARHGAVLVVDAAQSAGHLPVAAKDADVLVFSGHKGLFGPQGSGGMHVSDRVSINPLLQGGTGGRSEHPRQPAWLPHALEAGTLNGVGIAGLAAGAAHVAERGPAAIAAAEGELRDRFVGAVRDVPGVTVHGWPSPEGTTGVVSLTFDDLAANDAAALLEERHGVLVRGGLHCAPLAHRTLGTFPEGTVRVSLSHITPRREVDAAARAVADTARTVRGRSYLVRNQ